MHDIFILNRNKISNLAFALIFIMPFFRYYDIPIIGVSVETLLLAIITILCFMLLKVSHVENEKTLMSKSRNSFLCFFIWLYFITWIYEIGTVFNSHNSASSYSLMTYIMIVPAAYIIYSLFDYRWNVNNVFSIYSRLVRFVIYIYAIQWGLKIFGITISFKIPFLPYNDSWEYLNRIVFGMNLRPTSIFSEPAHLAEYLLPYLAICLFDNREHKNLKKATIITVIVISTASGNGIVGALILWGTYLMIFAKINLVYRIGIVLFGAVVCFFTYQLLLTIPTYSHIFGELFVNTTGKYSGTKADYRVYRGFDYYFQLPTFQKLTGIGYQHMHAFANEYNIASKFDSLNDAFEYFSTLTQVLIYSGVIGMSFFVNHLYSLWKYRDLLVKGLLILSVALWFSSQMLFANSHIMYMALIAASIMYEPEANES